MKILTLHGVAALACCALTMASPAYAHHSFAAEWDATKCRDFTGILRKLDWQNPHPYFFVDVKENGKVEQWSFQAYSPVTLRAMPAISEGSPRSRPWSAALNQFQQRCTFAEASCAG